MGRLGQPCLELKIPNMKYLTGKDVYDALLQRILKIGTFHGNNICNVIESLSRMRFVINHEL